MTVSMLNEVIEKGLIVYLSPEDKLFYLNDDFGFTRRGLKRTIKTHDDYKRLRRIYKPGFDIKEFTTFSNQFKKENKDTSARSILGKIQMDLLGI